jgi:hypothetical protein
VGKVALWVKRIAAGLPQRLLTLRGDVSGSIRPGLAEFDVYGRDLFWVAKTDNTGPKQIVEVKQDRPP